MFLNREQLLAATALKTEVVELPEGNILITEIGQTDYMDLCEQCKLEETEEGIKIDIRKFNPALFVYCVVDENGNRIFSMDDAEIISKRSQKPFQKILTAIKKLNGLLGEEGKPSEATETASTSGE